MSQKPTMYDLVQTKLSKNAELALRVAMRRASEEQNALLKKAVLNYKRYIYASELII